MNPPRLTRARSFLGVHFDFHAGPDCKDIGRRVTRASIERMLRMVRPDYVQCDTKGHRGLSSYPTRVGNAAPGFVRDPLRIWRAATARQGVALFAHHSGVWDDAALARHPSWGRVDEKGRRDKHITSVFGPYVHRLLIPQLKELADDYGLDGAWVDGECWATKPDYHPRVLRAFRQATGLRPPRGTDDASYPAFAGFCREAFRRYVRCYVDALHAHAPGFQVTSNWAFGSFMPEPVTARVDFLSGDYDSRNSLHAARWEGRCLAAQGMPWDLMAWGFVKTDDLWQSKSAVQLKREAAAVLALGGGVQVYFTQRRDASIDLSRMEVMAEVAQFCRARQRYCHRAVAVPQIAYLHSRADHDQRYKALFTNLEFHDVKMGTLGALLDAQYCVEVLGEHHMLGRMKRWPLIVLNEIEGMDKEFRRQLLEYVRRGGNLLLVGPGTAKRFSAELGIAWAGPEVERTCWIEAGGALGALKTPVRPVRLRRGTKVCGLVHASNDVSSPGEPVATVRRLGRGRIAGIYLNFGEPYKRATSFAARDFLASIVHGLFPRPLVEVRGSHTVDVSLARLRGQLTVNLVNTAGPHCQDSMLTWDEIPALGALEVRIRLPKRPRRIVLAPGRKPLHFTYARGVATCVVPRLDIHAVLLVEP